MYLFIHLKGGTVADEMVWPEDIDLLVTTLLPCLVTSTFGLIQLGAPFSIRAFSKTMHIPIIMCLIQTMYYYSIV